MMPSNKSATPFRVAVVGAGITGAVAASELAKADITSVWEKDEVSTTDSSLDVRPNPPIHTAIQVVVFDQGRRGPGGRASHRSVCPSTKEVKPDDWKDIQQVEGNYQFDHGCQFFRADSTLIQQHLLKSWLDKGWVKPWKARFGCLSKKDGDDTETRKSDFFGVPTAGSQNPAAADCSAVLNDKIYIGVGGMHLLPRRILNESQTTADYEDETTTDRTLVVHRGTRVQRVYRNNETNKWDLETIGGTAAYHDTKASDISDHPKSTTYSHFDAVLFTDISSSFGTWHRASAGIPDSFRNKLPPKVRIPLFSCMIVLKSAIRRQLPHDAFTTNDDKLWFAAVSQSKPGMCSDDTPECWTLISTPSFALEEIQSTTMRDKSTGEFKPQEDSYLNTTPGPAMAQAFLEHVRPFLSTKPEIVYLQAQRWGSGLPAPPSLVTSTVDICGTSYASELQGLSMVFPRPDCDDQDFVADDRVGLYYAGDFCSHRNPGFEAAALSGYEAAKHIILAANGDGARWPIDMRENNRNN